MARGHQPRPRYEEPFVWWGPVWTPPPERTLLDLIRDEVLTAPVAALLWGVLARRASIIVAAGPSGAGKTTVLTALLDCLPAGTRRIYVRGCYETFSFLDDAALDPARGILLINEISPHLPSYLWGPGVRRALAATRRGFSLAATAHAASVEELIGQLAGYPLRVPIRELAAINVVVMVTAEPAQGRLRRRVSGVWLVTAGQDRGLTVDAIATAHDISLQIDTPTAESPCPVPHLTEIDDRARFLGSLLALSMPLGPTEVRRALVGYERTEPTTGRG